MKKKKMLVGFMLMFFLAGCISDGESAGKENNEVKAISISSESTSISSENIAEETTTVSETIVETSSLSTDNKSIIETKTTSVVENTDEEDGMVVITELDKKKEYVILKNIGDKDIDIGNWKLISEKGADDGQKYIFPSDYMLKAGQAVKLVAGKDAAASEGAIVMAKKNIWNNSDYDPAILFDSEGNQIDMRED